MEQNAIILDPDKVQWVYVRYLDCYTNLTLNVWQTNITCNVKNKIKNVFVRILIF